MKQLTEAERKEVAQVLATVGAASNKLRSLLNLDEEHSDHDLMQAAYLLRGATEVLQRYLSPSNPPTATL